ncbi:ROK family protein [Pseudonocardia xinjiangensis]|uniref:ROK family protein n=1 Tax=Pseudonocardia xinjiangensis TaxID=75289 RepID=UPI003D91499A
MSFIGLDIGGTTTHAVLCDDDLLVGAEASAPTPARSGAAAMLDGAARLVLRLRGQAVDTVHGVGVAAAGMLDPRSGRIVRASDSFQGWEGTPVAAGLRERVDLPVVADNDVNCFLIGEVSAGALRGVEDGVGITLGTGVGGALWSGGRILHGRDGGAGELGHLPGYGDEPCSCGRRGHLETLAAGRSLLRRYLARGGTAASAADVAAAARAGDERAVEVFTDAARALGMTIVAATRLLAADRVVVGGGVTGAWDLLAPVVHEVVAAHPPLFGPLPDIRLTALGAAAVAVGAAALARLGCGTEVPA